MFLFSEQGGPPLGGGGPGALPGRSKTFGPADGLLAGVPSTSLAFRVAAALLALLRDMREPERFGFEGMHPVSARRGSGPIRCSVGCGVA